MTPKDRSRLQAGGMSLNERLAHEQAKIPKLEKKIRMNIKSARPKLCAVLKRIYLLKQIAALPPAPKGLTWPS